MLCKVEIVAAKLVPSEGCEMLRFIGQGATLADAVIDGHANELMRLKVEEWNLFHGLPPQEWTLESKFLEG